MKFFFRRKDEARPSSKRPEHMISMLTRDYNQLISRDTTIKIWLPESIETKMEEIATLFDCSVSDFIRQVLFVHLYGRYDFLGLVERDKRKETPVDVDVPVPDARTYGIMYSLTDVEYSSERCPDFKSVAGFKIWVPNKMKYHLNDLAERHKMSLSQYSREVIMIHLLGNIPQDRDWTI